MPAMVVQNRSVYASPTWHMIGTYPEVPSKDLRGFAEQGNMYYKVEKSPAYDMLPDGTFATVPNQWHLRRADDNLIVSPGTVTDVYGVISPEDMIRVCEDYVEAGWAVPDAFFCLYGGQSEVLALKLITDDVDGNEFYMILQNYHGRSSCRGILSSIRPQCHNMTTAAFAPGAEFSIPHKGIATARLGKKVAEWGSVREYLAKIAKTLNLFETIPCNVPSTVDVILGIEPGDEITTNLENKRDRLVAASRTSPGTSGKTLLDVWNGVTFDTSNSTIGRGGKTETDRLESLLDGTRGKFQQEALDKLMVLAGV